MDLRVQIDAKSGQLKIESMSRSANGKTINALDTTRGVPDNTPGVVPKGELQYLYIYIYKDAQESAPDVALEGTLLVALGLHVFMQLSMHTSVQDDSSF